MQGAVQPLYDPGASDVGPTGAVRLPVDAFHLTRTRLAKPPELWTKATCEPSSERTTELKTVPDVL